MIIADIIKVLEQLAPTSYQETYDNCGLLTGNASRPCTGIICTLDVTEDVITEAVAKGCNIVIAHHPIIFGGLKKLNGKNYIEKAVIAAIKNDIAIYAIHTNLDNVLHGVNHKIADAIGLVNRQVLQPKPNQLMKLFTYVPYIAADQVRNAIFAAGGGNIGNYSECSFNSEGIGTFKGSNATNPFVGEPGKRHEEAEMKLEVVFPAHLQHKIISTLQQNHPYEEVAYDIIGLANEYANVGSGLVGELKEAIDEISFLHLLKQAFGLQVIKHTPLLNKPVKKVALCGGAGSFLINKAVSQNADFYITGDVKYHEFFDANSRLVIADIGHGESEQFTPDLIVDVLRAEFPTFAVLKSEVVTNPVRYFM